MESFASDPQICRQCRGLCCQGHPGAYVDPQRFEGIYLKEQKISADSLQALLPFVGLELKNMDGVPVPAPRKVPWGCVFLGPSGCKLAPDARPGQCLALIPSLDTLLDGEIRCSMPPEYSYGAVRERWKVYWEMNFPKPV